MITSFKEFIDNLVIESLHPELQSVVSEPTAGKKKKQTALVKKIKDITSRGEKTGIEGNMPKGSSRAYLKHSEPHEAVIDGVHTKMAVGTKVAIRSPLDPHHDASKWDGMSLGNLQNEAENSDHFLNNNYRIITKHDKGRTDEKDHYTTNHESGIFPPLVEHDHDHHEWSQVGHVDNVSEKTFKHLTKTESHPEGISHRHFCDALVRAWDGDHGKDWGRHPDLDDHLDHVEEHPLVQKFLDHQRNFGMPPHDYRQIKNMGTWKHPVTGEKHIVARDHGFNNIVMDAYHLANAHKAESQKRAHQRKLDNIWRR